VAVDSVCVVLPATRAHAETVAFNIRDEDRAEIARSDGIGPFAALLDNIKASAFARTVFIEGEAVAMFGVAGENMVWMLSTKSVDRYPRRFWAASKLIIAELRKHYPVLIAGIDANYSRALTWARHLGFTIGPIVEIGPAKHPFHQVRLEA